MQTGLECIADHTFSELQVCGGDWKHYGDRTAMVDSRFGCSFVGKGACANGEEIMSCSLARLHSLREHQGAKPLFMYIFLKGREVLFNCFAF